MFLRWVTAAYLVYLVVPIALLLVGSFGELWLNTLLPTGSRLYSLISETASDFPAAAALALLITAVCSTIITTGEWVGTKHERHL